MRDTGVQYLWRVHGECLVCVILVCSILWRVLCECLGVY